MDYKNWYAVSINTNKEKSAKSQLLARKQVFKDMNLLEVEYLQRKELVFDKGGRRKVVNRMLMAGYLLVQVKPETILNEDGTTSTVFPADTFKLITETPDIKFFTNCNRDKPLPFRPREVKKMFDMCDEAHLEVTANVEGQFQEGDILEVIAGPFSGYDTEVTSVSGDKILGQIEMFGRTVPAEFNKTQVLKK